MKLVPFLLLEAILTVIGSVFIGITVSDYIKSVNGNVLLFSGIALLMIALVMPVIFKMRKR